MPIAPQSSTILIHSCFPAGTRARGTQPASAMAPNIIAAVWISVWVCSMSTVSQGNPERAMNLAAATLPRDSHVPICGLPACNARMTGFFFEFVPRFQGGCQRFSPRMGARFCNGNPWQTLSFPRSQTLCKPAQTTGNFQGSRYGRPSILAASSSPTICSVLGSQRKLLRPSLMAMLPR